MFQGHTQLHLNNWLVRDSRGSRAREGEGATSPTNGGKSLNSPAPPNHGGLAYPCSWPSLEAPDLQLWGSECKKQWYMGRAKKVRGMEESIRDPAQILLSLAGRQLSQETFSERKMFTPEGQRMKEQLAQTPKQIKLRRGTCRRLYFLLQPDPRQCLFLVSFGTETKLLRSLHVHLLHLPMQVYFSWDDFSHRAGMANM